MRLAPANDWGFKTQFSDALLESVLDAHRSLRNWANVKKLTAKLSLGGLFWGWRGWPDVYAGQMVTLEPHREHIEFAPFMQPDRVSILDVAWIRQSFDQ